MIDEKALEIARDSLLASLAWREIVEEDDDTGIKTSYILPPIEQLREFLRVYIEENVGGIE